MKVLPSVIVLDGAGNGQVTVCDIENKPLSEVQAINVVFVPVVLVHEELVTPDYVLYMFDDDKNLTAKLAEIEKSEKNAIIVIGTDKERRAYFIENARLSSNSVMISCGYSLDKINQLVRSENGKVELDKNNPTILATLIRRFRLDGGHANEAEITGTRTGVNVFSTSFGPCNPIIGKRKTDQQFVLHHADGASVDREGGIGKFITDLEKGGGAEFVVVMQNPNIVRSIAKAPLLAGGLAVELREKNLNRVNIPEGYSAVACINGATVIMAKRMEFFKNPEERKALISKFQDQEIREESRLIDIRDPSQIIPMSQTAKDVHVANQQMKKATAKEGPYKEILNGLKEIGISLPKEGGVFSKISSILKR
ncbi:hypothetical protein [Legionella cardiaca]|uniref:Uncharacterized protein n=1 Tax=Legionella cardiaca TaxID=1071983 RepID=A0ABY8AQ66_9GAMM|nr:hypothetical protein [Legionella cardiaca]WED42844.1 hypothetical protein PXX05_13215 [Legionella cardiaca]